MLGPIPKSTGEFEAILGLRNEADGNKVWSIVSHLPFFVLAAVGGWVGHKFTFVVALIIGLSSMVYHVCVEFDRCMGLPPIQTWTDDRFTAPLFLYLIFEYFITWHDLDIAPQDLLSLDPETQRRLHDLYSYDSSLLDHDDDARLGAPFNPPRYYVSWLEMWLTLAFVISALVSFYWPPGDLYPGLVVLVLCLIGWFLYAILRNERDVTVGSDRFMIAPTRPNWPLLIIGLALGAIGIGLYLVPETQSSLAHSFWHVFAACSGISFLFAKVMRPVEPLYVIEMHWRYVDNRP